ncbi:UDPGT domain-containing protein, partial [Cephalotus follicularis]
RFTMNRSVNAHVLIVSFPVQGHIAPLIKVAHKLVDHRVRVTFLTTKFAYARIRTVFIPPGNPVALPEMSEEHNRVRIVSVPDGLEPEDDRKDDVKVGVSISKVMPGYLEDLIKKANQSEGDEKIDCLIADATLGWSLEVAGKMGIKRAMFFMSSPGNLALLLHLPKLIESGIIDSSDGNSQENEKIQVSSNLPAVDAAELLWNCLPDVFMRKAAFEYALTVHQTVKLCNWVLCNWFHELEPSAENVAPNILPIGPLLAKGQPAGNFWMEDYSCLSWLDRQPAGSVIYAAFGSTSKFSHHQFKELALGLQLAGRPFLCVVRPDFTDELCRSYLDEFTEKLGNLGRIVGWAPQEMVLAHPSVACFMTHCGWNSSIEGLSMGVPQLCWPYFADQLYNKTCICEGWVTGLWLKPNEDGIVSRHEIKEKMDELLSNEGIRANALKLKQLAQKSVSQGGSSSKNLEDFVQQIKN